MGNRRCRNHRGFDLPQLCSPPEGWVKNLAQTRQMIYRIIRGNSIQFCRYIKIVKTLQNFGPFARLPAGFPKMKIFDNHIFPTNSMFILKPTPFIDTVIERVKYVRKRVSKTEKMKIAKKKTCDETKPFWGFPPSRE